MPNVYKLEYSSKSSLETALLSRGILETNEDGEKIKAEGTHAIVYLGNIVLEPATEETEAVISDKYHADIMVEGVFNFSPNEVLILEGEPQAHQFA